MIEKKILLIEDDRLVAKSIAFLLGRKGFKVFLAANGDAAKKLSQLNSFDLIISDIRMPDEKGTDVVKAVLAFQGKQVPFIFITGYAEEEYILEANRMKAAGFFLKPFDNNILLEKLQEIFGLTFDMKDQGALEGSEKVSRFKKIFYSALGAQWNPEKEIDWSQQTQLKGEKAVAMATILTPIIMGEFSAFEGLPRRMIHFKEYDVRQYLAVQLVDETRHAEAFERYLDRIDGRSVYKKSLRNIYTLRFFNGLKKFNDNDEWTTGLYMTEIMAHTLLSNYAEASGCPITQHLFRMILSDEARHISFGDAYMVSILSRASADERKNLIRIARNALQLNRGMLFSYEKALKCFNLDPESLCSQIEKQFETRFITPVSNFDRDNHQ